MGTVVGMEMSSELIAVQELEEAAKFLDLEAWIVRRLRQCEREITVNLELIRDDGEPVIVRGVRVQHCSVRGPCMGPLMFAKDMSVADARVLAMHLTWQSALWDLPFGGSAGWIGASVEDLSERETRLLTRAYVEAMRGVVRSAVDVLSPERGGHHEVNAWALRALGKSEREHLMAVTGKPQSMGGVEREKIAAQFLRGVVSAALNERGLRLEGLQVAIAGFGDEAQEAALELESAGAKIVAVCDRSGAVFHRNRLNVKALSEYVEKEDVLFEYPDAQAMAAEEMMQLPCDVLFLTTGHELLVPTKAKLVVEAGGTVNCMLHRETTVVPWLLGDAGMLMADFVEWRKSACGDLSERELLRGLRGQVRKTWADVWEYSRRCEVSLERAAMAMAVGKMAEAMRMG